MSVDDWRPLASRSPRRITLGDNPLQIMEQTMAQTDELLTVEEAADKLGVSVQRMYNLRVDGRGPLAYRRGRRLVYRRSDLDTFLAREREATTKGESR